MVMMKVELTKKDFEPETPVIKEIKEFLVKSYERGDKSVLIGPDPKDNIDIWEFRRSVRLATGMARVVLMEKHDINEYGFKPFVCRKTKASNVMRVTIRKSNESSLVYDAGKDNALRDKYADLLSLYKENEGDEATQEIILATLDAVGMEGMADIILKEANNNG